MATIYLEFEGEPTPITDLSWYFVLADGTVNGCMSAPGYPTAELAHASWTRLKRDRERELKVGLQIILGRHGRGELWDRMIAQHLGSKEAC